MTQDSSTRWISALALAISAGALGVSLATGCKSAPEAPAATDAPTTAAARASTTVPKTATAPAAPEPVASAPEAPAATPVDSEGVTPELAGTAELKVKRLVVASGIEEREPVSAESLVVGGPIFAFVELENEGDADGAVVITFEKESASVGHVELKIPADSPRWRTWGKTRNIGKAGEWTAVVRTKDGHELARQTFDVGTA